MMRYDKIKQLKEEKFRRLTGVKKKGVPNRKRYDIMEV